jgi:hypothetical protein
MMNMAPDLQKKVAAVAGFVVLAGAILYFELPHDGPAPVAPVVVTTPTTAAPAVGAARSAQSSGAKTGTVISVPPGNAVGSAAKSLGTTSAQLDPTLRMAAMLVTESLVYSGGGRNIFSASSVPVAIPKPIVPVRTGKALPPGPPPPPPGPPPPPPIDLTFFGTATAANGARRAFLLHGQDVFLASDGDVVQRRYKVITVSANSIVVEDMANNNRQTLPLQGR